MEGAGSSNSWEFNADRISRFYGAGLVWRDLLNPVHWRGRYPVGGGSGNPCQRGRPTGGDLRFTELAIGTPLFSSDVGSSGDSAMGFSKNAEIHSLIPRLSSSS